MENWSLSWIEALSGGLSGPARLRVQGRSMLPTLRPGDEVLVEPATADALVPGDWVVVAGAPGGFLHRFLGRRGDWVLTKGDGRFSLDPAWPAQAVLGRVTTAWRAERCIYRRTAGRMRRERWLAAGHRALGRTWGLLRRVKALLLSVLLVALMASGVYAAVTLSQVYTKLEGKTVVVYWVTGSETDNSGFHVLRRAEGDADYDDISGFVGSKDDGAGAVYTYPDDSVDVGVIYYYLIEDHPANNGAHQKFYDKIVTGTLPMATEEPTGETTPTNTPTPSPTPSPTKTPSPTPTPHPNVSFWASETELEAGKCTSLLWTTNHVNAVYLDSAPQVGSGSKTVCPSATAEYTLYVTFPDNTAETFTLTVMVKAESSAATLTPTPELPATGGPDETPEPTVPPETGAPPTETPEPTATPPQVRFPGTGTPPASPTPPRAATLAPGNTQLPATNTPPPAGQSPLATPQSQRIVSGTATVTRMALDGETVVEKKAPSSEWPLALLVFGVSVGIGLIVFGAWLWSRQQ